MTITHEQFDELTKRVEELERKAHKWDTPPPPPPEPPPPPPEQQ